MRSSRAWIVGAGVVILGVLAAWLVGREPWSRHEGPRLRTGDAQDGGIARGESRTIASRARSASRPRRFDAAWDEAVEAELVREIVGRVVDERRRPVEGAAVEAMGEAIGEARTTSGKDGRFRIDLGTKPVVAHRLEGAVVASDGKGRAAGRQLGSWQINGRVVEVGTIDLEAASPLTVRVLDDQGAAVAGAWVFLGQVDLLGFGPLVTDAGGLAGPRWVPHGAVVVRAFTPDLGRRGETGVDDTRQRDAPIDVVLAPSLPLKVRVEDAVTSRPIPGCKIVVEVVPLFAGPAFPAPLPGRIAPTDAEGRTTIAGLGRDPFTVRADPPSATESSSDPMDSAAAGPAAADGELVLRLGEDAQDLRFPIAADETPGPPDGAVVRLVAEDLDPPLPHLGRVAGRDLVVERVPADTCSFLAVAPDGSIGRPTVHSAAESRRERAGGEVRFKKPRTLIVSARDKAGVPLAGYRVQCVDTQIMVDDQTRAETKIPGFIGIGFVATTDGDGRVRIEGLYPEDVFVAIWRPGVDWHHAMHSTLVELEKREQTELDIVVERERSCLVHFTVDRQKELPGRLLIELRGGDVSVAEEDPENGDIRLRLRPPPGDTTARLEFYARNGDAVVELAIPETDAVLECNVELSGGVRAALSWLDWW